MAKMRYDFKTFLITHPLNFGRPYNNNQSIHGNDTKCQILDDSTSDGYEATKLGPKTFHVNEVKLINQNTSFWHDREEMKTE
jgi:hypothetical protein